MSLRMLLRLIRSGYFTLGWCRFCGRFGILFKDDRLHEACWLETK